MTAMIEISNAEKTFTMHLQGGIELPVVHGVSFHVEPGECVVLSGPSGAGKSSILQMIFGNYRCDRGRVRVRCGACAFPPSAMSASFCGRCRGWRRSTSLPSR